MINVAEKALMGRHVRACVRVSIERDKKNTQAWSVGHKNIQYIGHSYKYFILYFTNFTH
jgi:hypothetical protein